MRVGSAEPCPYRVSQVHGGAAQNACAVCGMQIRAGAFPHIVRVEPKGPTAHFCSVACLDNYPFLEEGDG